MEQWRRVAPAPKNWGRADRSVAAGLLRQMPWNLAFAYIIFVLFQKLLAHLTHLWSIKAIEQVAPLCLAAS